MLLFKETSIRKLLVIWAIGCSLLIVILVLYMVLADHYVNEKQSTYINRTISIVNSSQRLTKALTDFIIRKNRLIDAQSIDELLANSSRTDLEKRYYTDLNSIQVLLKDESDARDMIRSLEENYYHFLTYDDLIMASRRKLLKLDEHLLNKKQQLEILVDNITNTSDNISGVINLDISRTRREIRKTIEDPNFESWQLLGLLERSSSSKNQRVLKASQQVQQSVALMVHLTHEIIEENNPDILVSYRDNQVAQQARLARSALITLEDDLQHYPTLLRKIQSLEHNLSLLTGLLVDSSYDSSIYELRMQSLFLQKEIAEQKEKIDQIVTVMMEDVERLTHYASEQASSATVLSREVNQKSLTWVSLVSTMVVLILLIGINVVMNRINRPLQRISEAMSSLTHGFLKTRLNTTEFLADEFMLLAKDVNEFAEHNEKAILDLSETSDALVESEKRTQAIVENALVGIAHLVNRRFISVNQKFEEMFGYSRNEINGLFTEIIFPDRDSFLAVGDMAYDLLKNGDTYQSAWQVKRKDESLFWCAISAKCMVDGEPEKGTIWIYQDITLQKESLEELRLLANYDTLTGLPNRSLFMDRLNSQLELAGLKKNMFAVMFIDLDRFKHINDSLGHDAGDELLKHVARLLKECVRDSDTVARLGGDEFTVLLTDLDAKDVAGKIARKVISSLKQALLLDNQEVTISPSIGISIYPDDSNSLASLLRNADAAMYYAKSAGRNNYQFYTEAMNAESLHRLTFENRVRRAAERQEFVLHYQPQVDLHSGKVVGYEALLRWNDSELGYVSPVDFIPILEDVGLIIPVGEWVIRSVCDKISELKLYQAEAKRISINLSARQFMHNDIVTQVVDIVEEAGIDKDLIELEITESVLMTDIQDNEMILREFHDRGFRISLDDFGTGYSSLAYLKRFPIDVLKIDRSFVRDILSDANDAAICEAIIAMAASMNIKVVAEGVENGQQLGFLKEKGCDIVQGYLFGKPQPLDPAHPAKLSGLPKLTLLN